MSSFGALDRGTRVVLLLLGGVILAGAGYLGWQATRPAPADLAGTAPAAAPAPEATPAPAPAPDPAALSKGAAAEAPALQPGATPPVETAAAAPEAEA
ncbi:2-oxoglutarate dehydrogenase, E2 component, dihydrolipoamide succinyltransferase, partial [Rhodobacter sp. M37P]|nr:2-oxoglutarate dehydrogenase, E2 component, dihydrolipoamide succinyltransferase [Rhodobacter calidifons]